MQCLNSYLNGSYYNSLSKEARTMITNNKFFIGSMWADGINTTASAESFYSIERVNGVSYYNQYHTYNNVGLLYASDFIYTYSLNIDNLCFDNNAHCIDMYGGHPEKSWVN